MNVHMVFEVLRKSEFLSAELTREPSVRVMSYKMPPKAVLIGVCLSAVLVCTLKCFFIVILNATRLFVFGLRLKGLDIIGHK